MSSHPKSASHQRDDAARSFDIDLSNAGPAADFHSALNSENADAKISALSTQGLAQFDTLRFHYLQSLAEKLPKQRPAVAEKLLLRLQQATAQLITDYQRAKPQPVKAKPVTAPPSPLTQLIDLLSNSGIAPAENRGSERPETYTTGESATRENVTGETPAEEKPTLATITPPELKALAPLRDSWAKMNAEKLVMRSINEGPEVAGPLNPHFLAIRSLVNMRDLSPHYLNRFVAYMETLLWLEQSSQQKPARKKRKK